MAAVLGQATGERNKCADLQRVARPPISDECIGASHFGAPVGHASRSELVSPSV